MDFLTHETQIDVRTADTPSKFGEYVSSLPSVRSRSVPLNWLLSWPHMSTMYSALANFEKVDHIYYKRHVLEHADGGNNTLDFAVRTDKDLSLNSYESSGDRSLPARTVYMTQAEQQSIGSKSSGILVVLVHGLAGGSHENYIRRTITAIFRQYQDNEQVSIVAFNARGCARSKVTSKIYWNAAQIDDLASAIDFLAERYPNRKIISVGYSLGANILTNYLARHNSASKVSLGVAVSNPWNLLASNINLESYWLGRLYSTRMAAGLQRLYKRHSNLLSQHEGVDTNVVMAAKSLRAFDDAFTAKAFGYESAQAYYQFASSSRVVHQVKTNLIIINAKDDPMAPDNVLPYQQVKENQHLCMLAAHAGGHIGWYGPEDSRWFVDVIVESLDGLLKDLI